MVVEELSRGESQGEPAAVATPAGAGRAEYRLVRNVSREVASEAVCGGDATMEYVFDPEGRGQVYGTQSGPSRYTPPYKSGTSSAAPDGGAPRLPLNPPDLDEYNHMMYAEKATVVLKFNQASIEGQNGVVVKCDSTDSTNSTDTSTRRGESGQVFVPSPQSMVPLHSLLAMGPVYAGRLSSAVSVVQMSCDNYYHWTMECLPRLIVSLEFLKNNTVDTRGMTILLPMVKTKFITQVTGIGGRGLVAVKVGGVRSGLVSGLGPGLRPGLGLRAAHTPYTHTWIPSLHVPEPQAARPDQNQDTGRGGAIRWHGDENQAPQSRGAPPRRRAHDR